jgi:hypothetical protein
MTRLHKHDVVVLDVPVGLVSIGKKNSVCGRFVCFVLAALALQTIGV